MIVFSYIILYFLIGFFVAIKFIYSIYNAPIRNAGFIMNSCHNSHSISSFQDFNFQIVGTHKKCLTKIFIFLQSNEVFELPIIKYCFISC
eukprot:UN26024